MLFCSSAWNKALKHTYTWDSERVDEKCDGEKCGRRLKCFSDKLPGYPPHWGIYKVLEHQERIYDSYVEMKKVDIMAHVMALQAIRDAPPERLDAVLKAAVDAGFISMNNGE